MADVVMPRLSDSMEEGTILQWLKQVGDEVAVGDELVEIETDKANMAYESDVAGTLTEILAEEGETLPIGSPIARVGDSATGPDASAGGPAAAENTSAAGPGEDAEGALRAELSSTPSTSSPPAEEAPGAAPEPPAAQENAPAGGAPVQQGAAAAAGQSVGAGQQEGDGRVKASPLARRMAKARDVDLAQLRGSGPGGRVIKLDVERAASSGGGGGGGVEDSSTRGAPPTPPLGPVAEMARPVSGPAVETAKGEVSFEDLSKLQSTVSRRMAESKATAPHFYLEAEVDMTRAVEARGRVKELAAADLNVPSFNDMVVKACGLALREHPRANGAYRDGRFELYSRVNVGIAVAARDALVVPTVFDADRKGLWQIGNESRALAERVRDGSITPPELSGATFTVSNLGMFGIDSFAAVINPPQAAILAVGAIRERPVVRDGELATAHIMRLNLACDHRILYGAQGAEFLARIVGLLEEPFSLAL
jgi:pyruvate dehydrogenase E2 component (dihydrolipoyllysine-residue acetyltransferase)